MQNKGLIVIFIIFLVIFTYVIFIKPAFYHYDNAICFTGDIGAGKTKQATTTARKLIKKSIKKCKFNNWKIRQINKIKTIINNKHTKWNYKHAKTAKKYKKIYQLKKEQTNYPKLFSNIPVLINKKHGKKEFSCKFSKEMFMLIVNEKDPNCSPIPEGSVVLIDETPQLINQFNWNIPEVQNNVNEFITFFRHYFNGHLIMTAQAKGEIVKQIKTKFSTYYYLTGMQKFFNLFYRVRVLELTEIDENTINVIQDLQEQSKYKYGCFFPKIYDSRCYSERYPRDKIKNPKYYVWTKLKTNKIIRFNKGKSPLENEEGSKNG